MSVRSSGKPCQIQNGSSLPDHIRIQRLEEAEAIFRFLIGRESMIRPEGFPVLILRIGIHTVLIIQPALKLCQIVP